MDSEHDTMKVSQARLASEVFEVKDGALRGLATGIIEPALRRLRPCLVFGLAFPCWLPALQQMGYEPVFVGLQDGKFTDQIRELLPVGSEVVVGRRWETLALDLDRLSARPTVAFIDGRGSGELFRILESIHVHLVFTLGWLRRLPPNWKTHHNVIKHNLVGGASTSSTTVVAFAHCSLTPHDVLELSRRDEVPMDMSTLLYDKTPTRPRLSRSAEAEENLSNFEIRDVSGSGATQPIYHGGGWLPPFPTFRTLVKTRSVYLPPNRWAIRPLLRQEFLAVYDWSDRCISKLAPFVHEADFPLLHPVKSLVAGVCSLSALLRGSGGNGGGTSFSLSSPLSSPSVLTPPETSKPVKRALSSTLLEEEEAVSMSKRMNKLDDLNVQNREEVLELHHEVSRESRERKATKSDDAEVPIYLWTEHYMESSLLGWNLEDKSEKAMLEKAMETLRGMFIMVYKRRLIREFCSWVSADSKPRRTSDWVLCQRRPSKKRPDETWTFYSWSDSGRDLYKAWFSHRLQKRRLDFEAGCDAVQRACRSTWWEWSDGSRPFHWRWPGWYRSTIRDGIDFYLAGDPPRYRVAQRDERDPDVKEKVKAKLDKVRDRRYIAPGYVSSLTSFFSVPKGDSDIRMVYDGTKSGLNEAQWVPRFGMSTIDTHLRAIEEGTYLADVDVGDCFLNFPLHKKLRALAGVDLTHYFPNSDGSRVWECWHRALMGAKGSPYQAVQGMMVAEEVIRGDRTNKANVFHWERVRMNCPGDPNYDSSKPWVSKIRDDGSIAPDLVGYVDDLRPSGGSRSEAWLASRRTASVLNYLGIQDAARKRRDSSRTPGAWAGSVVLTRGDGVYVMCEQSKWDKAKRLIGEVKEMIKTDPNRLDRKRLEQIRGFLIHVVRTYPALKPYIQGLHLTIDGWRDNRDKEGYKIAPKVYEEMSARRALNDEHEMATLEHKGNSESAKFVVAMPRLLEDMEALSILMQDEKPRLRRVRSKAGRRAVYCFGDASASAFGRTLMVDGKLYYQFGQWTDEKKGKSSNWREARNLLLGLKRAAEDHALTGLEVFIFTDNSTAEGAFWKGYSPVKALSEIVLEMRKLEMKYDLILHVTHVSGSRMICQGTDGLSRADHSTGVMIGEEMSSFIPLNESALLRSPILKKRLEHHLAKLNPCFLEPEDWFEERKGIGNYIWAPPPAAADVVVDQLNKLRHKRSESMHLVLVPRLMTGRWRRMMTRGSDFYFKIDWTDCWDESETFWLKWKGYCQNKTCRKWVTPRNGIFCANFCFGRGDFAPCKSTYCAECFVPRGGKPFVVREIVDSVGNVIEEKEDNRYRKARPGDMLMVPFQCDLCHFRNITKRDPCNFSPQDSEVLEYIRRASLDSFWSRETSTVQNNLRLITRAEKSNAELGLPPLVPNLGPFPLSDDCGMQVAIAVLIRSLDKGAYERFVQWETFRRTRSAITNARQACVGGLQDIIGAYERDRLWVSKVPTHSFWFVRFMEGLHRRVGEVIKQDWSIPINVLKYIDESLDELWSSAVDFNDRFKIAEMGTWFVVGFCTGLRGEEMLMIELAGTIQQLRFLRDPTLPHFLLQIRGRTKSSQLAGSTFQMPCVAVTEGNRLRPGLWIDRLVNLIRQKGRHTGRLFQRKLPVPRLVEFEDDWYNVLEKVQKDTDLIDKDLDLRDKAGILRSLRRGVTAHAINMKVDTDLTRAINRWRSEKKNGDKKPKYEMIDRYADLGAIKPTYLRFSQAL